MFARTKDYLQIMLYCHIILTVLFCFIGKLDATTLPSNFVLENSLIFYNLPDFTSIPQGVGSLELGPDGNLWLFNAPGDIQVIDPVDAIFFNGDDIVSPCNFGGTTTGNLAVFTQDGNLLSATTYTDSASLKDSVDGIFFNGDDTVLNFTWPFGVLPMHGRLEPGPAAFGPDEILYITGYPKQLLIYDPIDGDLSNDTFAFSIVALPFSEFLMNNTWSIAFDSNGNMFIADLQSTLVGIDPVDGIFFNGNDIHQFYSWNSIFAGVSSPKGDPGITDIAFDQQGNLLLFDAGTQMLHSLRPSSAVLEPSTILLLGFGLAVVGLLRRFRN